MGETTIMHSLSGANLQAGWWGLGLWGFRKIVASKPEEPNSIHVGIIDHSFQVNLPFFCLFYFSRRFDLMLCFSAYLATTCTHFPQIARTDEVLGGSKLNGKAEENSQCLVATMRTPTKTCFAFFLEKETYYCEENLKMVMIKRGVFLGLPF